jgi:hypothetical protein
MTVIVMSSDKKQRVATAVGFISGLLATLDALHDLRSWWPPDEVWLCCGLRSGWSWPGGLL